MSTPVVVVLALALAGCGGAGSTADERGQATERTSAPSTSTVRIEGPGDAETNAAEPTSPAVQTQAQARSDGAAIAVSSITDGDTLRLTDGRSVRLAQVDAPETSECFGSESTEALRALAGGTSVVVRRPPSGPERDRYGRTLGDLIIGDTSINETLVATGAAEWYEEFAHEDADLARRLEAAEAKARAAGLGLWSACRGGAPVSAPPVTSALVGGTGAPAAPAATTTPAGAGDCHPAYPDVCLPPAPPDLDCADVGQRVRVDRTHGDPHGLDGEGDGWGCESYG